VALLAEGALSAGFRPESIHNILDEVEAAEVCLKAARPGDLVVLTPTSVDEMWQQVLAFGSPESARQVPAQTGESCGAAA
jgi:cyanophycin synthetase